MSGLSNTKAAINYVLPSIISAANKGVIRHQILLPDRGQGLRDLRRCLAQHHHIEPFRHQFVKSRLLLGLLPAGYRVGDFSYIFGIQFSAVYRRVHQTDASGALATRNEMVLSRWLLILLSHDFPQYCHHLNGRSGISNFHDFWRGLVSSLTGTYSFPKPILLLPSSLRKDLAVIYQRDANGERLSITGL